MKMLAGSAPLSVAVLAAAGIAAWMLTGWFRQYALARGMVDVPNPRSSHQVVTPRGGGAAIVVVTTIALAWWAWTSQSMLLAGLLAGGLMAAAVGFIDDHRPVPPGVRLIGHAVSAAVAVGSLAGASTAFAGASLATAGVGVALAVVFVTWLINLTNFMDGIDGIAGVETLSVCGVAAALSAMVAPGTGLWFEPAVLAAASTGYLLWNWPPARVFMGDAGSGFIGYMLAALTMRAAMVAPDLGWCWLILSGVFIVDATVTLVRRAARGDRLFQAHRSHAYQHLAIAWGHRDVTLLVAAINVCWLAPVAALVAFEYLTGPVGLAVAYAPLIIGAARLGAGAASR